MPPHNDCSLKGSAQMALHEILPSQAGCLGALETAAKAGRRLAAATFLMFTSASYADTNVLLIEPRTGFEAGGIKTQLENILNGAGVGAVNVSVTGPDQTDQENLSGWIHDPSHNAQARYDNLAGNAGTAWDYIIILENPEVIETFPGWYAQGVHDVVVEVERGQPEAVLMMQWPSATSAATLDYYREVAYRVGRGRDLKVVPAGLAWDAAGSPGGTTQGDQDAAYVAAATIYSRLWNASAADSTYEYDDALAATAFQTVNTNKGVVQYTGEFNSAPNGLHKKNEANQRKFRWGYSGVTTQPNGVHHEGGILGNLYYSVILNGGMLEDTNKLAKDLNFRNYIFYQDPIFDNGQLPQLLHVPFCFIDHGADSANADTKSDYVKRHYSEEAFQILAKWNEGDTTVRQMSSAVLLAQARRHLGYLEYDTFNRQMYGSYLTTMMTGRPPIPLEPDGDAPEQLESQTVRTIAYETAWRFSTLHGRAPGFKVWPEIPLRFTVGEENTDMLEMKVAFAMEPKADVTVHVTTDYSEAQPQTQTLTFTPQNHLEPQSVFIKATQSAVPSTEFNVIFTTSSTDVVCNELVDKWPHTINNRPIANDLDVTVNADALSVIALDASDADNDPLTYEIVSPPSSGTAQLSTLNVGYQPNAGFIGSDSFTYRAKDYSAYSEIVTVNITVQPRPAYGSNLVVNGSAELYPFTEFGWTANYENAWVQSPSTFDGAWEFQILNTGDDAPWTLSQDIDVSDYLDNINSNQQIFQVSGTGWRGNPVVNLVFLDSGGLEISQFTSPILSDNSINKISFSEMLLAPVGTSKIRLTLSITGRNNIIGHFDRIELIPMSPPTVPDVDAGADDTATLGDFTLPEPFLEWDASQDTNGNHLWESSTTNSHDWVFDNGNQSPVAVSDSRFVDLTHAYSFPAAVDISNAALTYDTTSPATFEFVIDADADDGQIFETGQSGRGLELDIKAGILTARVNGAAINYTLTADDKARFMHVIFVADPVTRLVRLFVDGNLIEEVAWGGTRYFWSNSDPAGLGASVNYHKDSSKTPFVGKMALIRFYRDKALTQIEAAARFNTLSGQAFGSTELNGMVSNPEGYPPVISWSLVSGPAPVSIYSPDAESSFVGFTQPGTYTFRLTATDFSKVGTDEVVITVQAPGGTTFADWIAGYDVGSLSGFGDDADGDGKSNGLENFLGTDPSQSSPGVMPGSLNLTSNTFTFSHPYNPNHAPDLVAEYRWSTDLTSFHANGGTDGDSTTVNFQVGTPADGWVTVTATISGPVPEKMFIDIEVTQP